MATEKHTSSGSKKSEKLRAANDALRRAKHYFEVSPATLTDTDIKNNLTILQALFNPMNAHRYTGLFVDLLNEAVLVPICGDSSGKTTPYKYRFKTQYSLLLQGLTAYNIKLPLALIKANSVPTDNMAELVTLFRAILRHAYYQAEHDDYKTKPHDKKTADLANLEYQSHVNRVEAHIIDILKRASPSADKHAASWCRFENPGAGDCLYHAVFESLIHDCLTGKINRKSPTWQAMVTQLLPLLKNSIRYDERDLAHEKAPIVIIRKLLARFTNPPRLWNTPLKDLIHHCDWMALLRKCSPALRQMVTNAWENNANEAAHDAAKALCWGSFRNYVLSQQYWSLALSDSIDEKRKQTIAQQYTLAVEDFTGSALHDDASNKALNNILTPELLAITNAVKLPVNVLTPSVPTKDMDEEARQTLEAGWSEALNTACDGAIEANFNKWWQRRGALWYQTYHSKQGTYAGRPQQMLLANVLHLDIRTWNSHTRTLDSATGAIKGPTTNNNLVVLEKAPGHFWTRCGGPDNSSTVTAVMANMLDSQRHGVRGPTPARPAKPRATLRPRNKSTRTPNSLLKTFQDAYVPAKKTIDSNKIPVKKRNALSHYQYSFTENSAKKVERVNVFKNSTHVCSIVGEQIVTPLSHNFQDNKTRLQETAAFAVALEPMQRFEIGFEGAMTKDAVLNLVTAAAALTKRGADGAVNMDGFTFNADLLQRIATFQRCDVNQFKQSLERQIRTAFQRHEKLSNNPSNRQKSPSKNRNATTFEGSSKSGTDKVQQTKHPFNCQ